VYILDPYGFGLGVVAQCIFSHLTSNATYLEASHRNLRANHSRAVDINGPATDRAAHPESAIEILCEYRAYTAGDMRKRNAAN
jgi:hypothetical protein